MTMERKNALIAMTSIAVALITVMWCLSVQSADKTALPIPEKKRDADELIFRAGANVAAKLIFENPNKYRTSLEVQDAAWKYMQPIIKEFWKTNAP